MMLAQSWAVRRWALKRFAKVDDYLHGVKEIVLAIVESKMFPANGIATVAEEGSEETGPRERSMLS
jgi:hypothetical protein